MFQDKIREIIAGIDSAVERAQQRAIVQIAAVSTSRIFDKGLDKNETSIGRYSESYKATRKKKGLQTAFVDLTNTTTLNKSIVNNDSQVYFKNDYGVKVSGYNETRFNKRIFAPSQDEAQIFYDVLNEELTKLWK